MIHRTISHFGGLPDPRSGGLRELLIFFCARCRHVEMIKEDHGPQPPARSTFRRAGSSPADHHHVAIQPVGYGPIRAP
jgi:hypothetical protein